MLRCAILSLSLLFPACSSSSNPEPSAPGVDAGAGVPTPDAAVVEPAKCSPNTSFGDLGMVGMGAFNAMDGMDAYIYLVHADIKGTDDLLVELWAEAGSVFAAGIKTGTFPLTGNEATYDTCGACVMIESAELDYIATGGTLKLTSIAGKLTGSLENVTLEGFEYDNADNLVARPDCMATIARATFDLALAPEPP
jgi:hypothetical protein